MRRLVLSLLLCSASALPAFAQGAVAPTSAVHFPGDSAVMAILRQRVAERRSAGIVVGMLEADGRTRVVAVGDPGPGRRPLDESSVFEIGSITKVFTSTVLSQLAREGTVRLDDPAQRYLPATVHVPEHGGKAITLLTLAEQNSGLPYMPGNFQPADAGNPFADYGVDRMYDFLTSYQLTRDPGAQFEYSNLGVGLLGHVLSRAAGTSYETLVRDRITGPLHMSHTAIALDPWMREHLVLGHGAGGAVVPNWDIPGLAGAGALRSTAADMLRFADAALHPERGALERAMADAERERVPAMGGMWIGLNWFTLHAGADTIVWHNGGTGGYRTFIGLVPSRRIAVVVLTNSGGAGADDIGMHLLSPALPLMPAPRPPRMHTEVPVAASVLARHVGTYRFTPAFAIEVTLEGDVLRAQATGQQRLRLWPEGETEFFLKEVDAQVTFVRDAAGATTGLVLHQNGLDQPAPKVPASP